jgi:hypothetical protein
MDPWVPNLSWIQSDLAVGGSFPCERTLCLAQDHGVGAVIDLRDEARDERRALRAHGLTFLHLPTPDMTGASQPMLDQAIGFARAARHEGRRLLIHCEHGIGRSATAALCVLVDRGLAPLDALRLAKTQRAAISPSRSQYDAWVTWLGRYAAVTAPTYHEFGVVAYSHLAKSA